MDALDQLQPAEELILRSAAERARGPRPKGPSRQFCECGAEIPATRRAAVPGLRTCIDCQRARFRRLLDPDDDGDWRQVKATGGFYRGCM